MNGFRTHPLHNCIREATSFRVLQVSVWNKINSQNIEGGLLPESGREYSVPICAKGGAVAQELCFTPFF